MSTSPDSSYKAPEVTDLGTLAEQTLTVINKTPGSADIIVINGQSISVPGSAVIP